jgi:hypothetical protein
MNVLYILYSEYKMHARFQMDHSTILSNFKTASHGNLELK